MIADDLLEFFSKLTMLAELFDAKFSEAKQQLYAEALSDIDLDDLVRGMQQAVRECRFMPKPVELREFSVGSDESHAEDAWLEFKDAMRRIGSYGKYEPESSAQRAIDAVFGSYQNACRSELTPEMLQARKKEFMRVFVEGERSYRQDRILPPGTIAQKLLGS